MGNACGNYSFRDVCIDDASLLDNKLKFEKIQLFEADLAIFYTLLRYFNISVAELSF